MTIASMGWITPEGANRFMVTPYRTDGTANYMEAELIGETFVAGSGTTYRIISAFQPAYEHPHGKRCYIVAVEVADK